MENLNRFRSLFMGFFVFFFLFQACTSSRLTPFTREIYESHNWSDADLKRIQFYLSEDLVIYRNLEDKGDVRIANGEIKRLDGRKVEEVRFRRGTPGVFLFRPKEDHFAVSFESGDDARYLMFGPNPKLDGQYMLLASEWNRRTGKVTYAGEKFQTASSEIPRLLVSLKQSRRNTLKTREAHGRKID